MARRGRVRRETRLGSLRVAVPGVDGLTREPADATASQQLDGVAVSEAIGRAFDRLAEKDGLLLVLHYVEERPIAEIAKTVGVAVGTVKWRLHQARTALEQAMEAEA